MKGKKLLVGMLSAAMVLGAMSYMALADDETAATVTDGSALAKAIASGATEITIDGEVIVNADPGFASKNLVIKGDPNDGTADTLVFNGAIGASSAKIAFSDLTLSWPNDNFNGLQHASELTYDNCQITGQPFLYAETETFNGCTFIQDSSDSYNVWTYGAKNVTFNACNFKCKGKSILVYNEGAVPSAVINVNGCEFIADSPVDGKAAIEIDSSLISGGYTINIDTDEASGETVATGFAEGSKSGNTLYNAKKFKVVKDEDKALKLDNEVNLKGSKVAPVSDEVLRQALAEKTVATIGEKAFDSLSDAFGAAKEGDAVTLSSDMTIDSTINIKGAVRKGITFDGNGKTITFNGGGGIWFDNYSDFTVENLTAEGEATYGITLNGGKNKTLRNVKMSGTYVFPFMNLNTGGATLENCDFSNTKTGEVYGGFLASSVWANVDSAYGTDMLSLVNSTIDGITINGYRSVNYLMPKIVVDEQSKTTIYTYDGASLSKTRLMCVSPESKGDYTVYQVLTNAEENITGISESIKPVAKLDTTIINTAGETKNFGVYFENINDAVASAKANDTITLSADVTTDTQLVFSQKATLDLNGFKLTSDYAMGTNEGDLRYAVVFADGGTIKDSAADGVKGELTVNNARAVKSNGDTLFVTGAKIRVTDAFHPVGGQAVIGTTGGLNMKKSVIIGEFAGSYAVSSFGTTTETYTITDSVIKGTDIGLYRNGSKGEFTAIIENTEIAGAGTDPAQAVYISNNDAYPDHNVVFTNCSITGKTGIEAKYTNLTLDNCTVTATGTPSYSSNGNGGTASGFAVALSDNSSASGTIAPRGEIIIKGNGEYNGLIGLENLPEAKNHMGTNVTDVKIYAGSFNTDISAYCAPGFSAKLIGGKYIVDETANKITLQFKETADSKVYDIVLSGNGQDINRLNTADFTFAIDNSSISYTVAAADGMTLSTTADPDRYAFNFNGKTGVTADSGATIKIGTVTFEGYGRFKFSVKDAQTNLVTATAKGDNLVTEFVVGAVADKGTLIINDEANDGVIDTELTVPTKALTVNISFPNAVSDNEAIYQDMKVTIAGGTVNEAIALGTDAVAMTADGYTITKDLAENTSYTVTVSGAGYRTARYTVMLNGDKTLNFWNNAKDAALEVEEGNANSKKNVTFLAGDIVKDNSINIYDLSAVVSYFGTDNLISDHPEYAKYDLNRDGKIDSKDVAYVLVSWGK